MNISKAKDGVLAIVKQNLSDNFFGEITEGTKLTDLFGENQWHTRGFILIVELGERFNINIPLDKHCGTVGDLINLVVEHSPSTSTTSLLIVKRIIFLLDQVLDVSREEKTGQASWEKTLACFYERLELMLKISFTSDEILKLKNAYEIKQAIVNKLAVSDNPDKELIIDDLKWIWILPPELKGAGSLPKDSRGVPFDMNSQGV